MLLLYSMAYHVGRRYCLSGRMMFDLEEDDDYEEDDDFEEGDYFEEGVSLYLVDF